MTSQKAQIQALLNGIDEALSKSSPRLPWVMSSDAMQQRQILEQTRQYLVSLQQQLDAEPSSGTTMTPGMSPSVQAPSESAQQVLQAVLQEMNYWRVNMLQPLRAEVDSLQRQREMLTQEIRQLEAQRYQYGLSQQAQVQNQQILMEFLQSAMAQMQANLSGQVTQMMASLSAQAPAQLPAQTEASSSANLSPAERLAQMQQMQTQSDQLMRKLDSTLQILFESLNRNVQAYQESLEQGLNRMHSLGQQGEAMFAFLVNRLAQQLGREASSFLQSSTSDWQSSQPVLPGQDQSSDASFTVADFLSQVSESPQPASSFTPVNLSEEVLDIAELDQADQLVESNTLDGLDLELNRLDLSAVPSETEAGEPFDLFAGDQPLPTSDRANSMPADSKAASSITSDLDSALDLLNQLSAEMQAGLLDNAPMQPSASGVELSNETELITTPDSLYNDDFYNNLFQEPEINPAAGESSIDALTLEQEWFGGLADPAVQSEPQSATPPAAPSSVSQSLETFLLNDATTAPTSLRPEKTEDLFADFPAPPQDTVPEPVETVASLSELVPDLTNQPASNSPAVSNPQQPRQEEVLPIAEAAAETLNVNLGLDTLENLGVDLAESTAESTEASTEANSGWDLFANVPPVEAPQLPTEPEPASLTIEGLEELFEDLPNVAADSTPSDATFRFGNEADASRSEDADSSEKKKDLTEVRLAPIGRLPTLDHEWTPETSWTAPAPEPGTLAELIQDLTAGLNAPPLPTQPIIDVASVEAAVDTSVEISEVSVEAPADRVEAPSETPADSLTAASPSLDPNLKPSLGSEVRSDSAEVAIDPSVLEQLDQLLAEPPTLITLSSERSGWFLGIDIGTTGISAVLLNQAECQLYPLYWQPVDPESTFTVKKKFRLPTAVILHTGDASATPLPTIRLEPASASRLSLSEWKPYLRVAVPHYSPQTSQWEPVLQWTQQQTVALRTLQEALQHLLTTLNPERAAFMPTLVSGALGLETPEFQAVLRNLTGVVVGYPSNWSDTYCFNLREAILQAGLVPQPDQIVFVEEAIATLLSALPATDGRCLRLAQLSHGQNQQQTQGHLHNANWQGMTLILSAGASLTELVLVNLPQQLQNLNHTDFYVRSLPYAGQSLDQDILTQLLYPALLKAQQQTEPNSGTSYDFALDPFDLSHLQMADLALPVADLDLTKRHQLQQHLTSSTEGHQLLAAARSLKVTLQQQTRFTLKYGTQRLTIERQDFTSQVLLPYVQRLNRELNSLLAQTNTTAAAIHQVICTGGTASLAAVARWLRQKLPNATIIQDSYPRMAAENCIPSCSRVAYGLATLPLHPQVLNLARHRYSDYFLLLALLRSLPQQPLRIETIMQILEQQGIDTQSCRFRILALLDGHLPSGLIPAEADTALLTPASAANPDYQAMRLALLFHKPADRTYEPNRHQWEYLQQYLATLLADSEQTLSQPLEPVFGKGARV